MKATIYVLTFAAAAAAILIVGCKNKDSAASSPAATRSVAEQPVTPVSDGASAEASTADSSKPAFKNEKGEVVCVVSGDLVAEGEKAGNFTDYNGKRYFFCCAACLPKFQEDPELFAEGRAIKEGKTVKMH